MNTDNLFYLQALVPNINCNKMKKIFALGLICLVLLITASLSHAEGTTAEMIQSWKDRAKQGDAYAPFQLGVSYQNGQGVKKNLVEAAKWYQIGAERGDLHAALTLADMYLKGEGVQQNEEKAIELYTKVGKSVGWYAPIARANLLVLARNYSLGGEGVKPNKTKAHAIFKRLFEIETALMDKGQAEMDKSIQKANEAADTIMNTPKEVFDDLKKTK